jgi:glutathione S-transferase
MLTLYFHPLASFCHKVLIALYENGTAFVPVTVDLGNPDDRAALKALWPLAKFPVLVDGGRVIPETSIIIEYLQAHHPGPVRLLPDDPDDRLDVRLWDRVFDLYVSQPMQAIVGDRLRPEGAADPQGVAEARAALQAAYDLIEGRMAGRDWAAGTGFSLADCAAAPGLFYAAIVEPFGPARPALSAYFDRLMARPSVVRVLDEARPWFKLFPYREAMPPRFL